jgi:hypothetical protein
LQPNDQKALQSLRPGKGMRGAGELNDKFNSSIFKAIRMGAS